MRRFLVLLLCSSTLLQGCVGVMLHYPVSVETENPELDTRSNMTGAESLAEPIPLSEFVGLWGEPDVEGDDYVVYYRDTLWAGAIFMLLIVPVPVMAPIGRERIELAVQDGMVVRATAVDDRERYFLLGFVPTFIHLFPMEFGFHTGYHD